MSLNEESGMFGMGQVCSVHGDEHLRECSMCGAEFCRLCHPRATVCPDCADPSEDEEDEEKEEKEGKEASNFDEDEEKGEKEEKEESDTPVERDDDESDR